MMTNMLDTARVHLSYSIDGKKKTLSFQNVCSDEALDAERVIENKEGCKVLTVTLHPKRPVVLEALFITLQFSYDTRRHSVYVNGYQSWTDSREFLCHERMPGISKWAMPFAKKYYLERYGDTEIYPGNRRRGVFHGFTYSYIRHDDSFFLIGSLTEKQGFTIIEHNTHRNGMRIVKDCKGLLADKTYTPFKLLFAEGSEDEVFDTYFSAMAIKKPAAVPMTGWTSWYNYYQNISEDIILNNLEHFHQKKQKIGIFQIDDGYQTAVGDWLSVDTEKFPHGMKHLASKIKAYGYKAGLWLAPFVCEEHSHLFENKKSWILRDQRGRLVKAGSNWSGFYALDLENPEVKDYIREVFRSVLDVWGFDMVKLDFLYAACLIPRPDKTRGQIMTEAMEFLRECVGDKLILGCGVPLGPSFGLVDYCRIGCDVGLDWNDKYYMRFMHRERISTQNAIQNAIGRRHLDGRAFLNDPDVFLLRDENLMLTDTQKKTLYTVNTLFGSLVFTSDDIGFYDWRKEAYLKALGTVQDNKIHSVSQARPGLFEISLRYRGRDCIMLVNLKNKKLAYEIHGALKRELVPGGNAVAPPVGKKLVIGACESRIFEIQQGEREER